MDSIKPLETLVSLIFLLNLTLSYLIRDISKSVRKNWSNILIFHLIVGSLLIKLALRLN